MTTTFTQLAGAEKQILWATEIREAFFKGVALFDVELKTEIDGCEDPAEARQVVDEYLAAIAATAKVSSWIESPWKRLPELVAAGFCVSSDLPESQVVARARAERKRLATKLLDEAYAYATDSNVRRRL